MPKKNGKNGNGADASAKKRKKAAAQEATERLAAISPDDIRSGIAFGLVLLGPIAKRTTNKVDDGLVAFLEVAAIPGNIERFLEILEDEA